MARTLPALADPTSVATINLSRLLSRLNQKLSSLGEDEQHVPSSLERAKIAANLEYARQLLQTLETESNNIKSPALRQRKYTELGEQKQAIRRLNENLNLLAQQRPTEGDEDAEEMPQSSTAVDGLPKPAARAIEDDDDDYASLAKQQAAAELAARSATIATAAGEETATTPAPSATVSQSATAAGVRNRFPNKALDPEKAALFGTTSGAETQAGVPADKDSLLFSQQKEQDALTENMLSMAAQLKEAAMAFGQSLEDEKVYLDQAKEGLERNAIGMESAGNKMDNLRKNDNVSWLWSMIYLGIIFALTMLIMLVMMAMPKIRWW